MRLISTIHNHTVLDDGKDTPLAMAEAALAAGFTDFGISGHSPIPCSYETEWCVQSEAVFVKEIRALQKYMAGKLRIWVGMEQDWLGPVEDRAQLDYLIGSVHALYSAAEDRCYWMDGSPASLAACRDKMFGGSIEHLVRAFYEATAENAQRYKPDVIGHFDLLMKNNADNAFFDAESPACRAAALEALHACLDAGAVLEVNTGGMYRGYCKAPYPARFILEETLRCGGRVTLNADAHEAAAVTYRLAEAAELLRSVGFREYAAFENGAFVQKPLG